MDIPRTELIALQALHPLSYMGLLPVAILKPRRKSGVIFSKTVYILLLEEVVVSH